ncbi:hypothetical protein [Micromonospora sp. CPCC 205556]|uniref:hypothetical protein n=1 Tax=Micromonospora sp. CPCC 205556 TaxID=3122398 RepID=UPI002FF422F5
MTQDERGRPGGRAATTGAPGPEQTRSAMRRIARSRRRRRSAVEGLTAAACLAALIAYLGTDSGPEPREGMVLPAGAPTAAGRPPGPGEPAGAGVASPGLRPRQRPPSPTPTPSTPTPPSASAQPVTPVLTVSRADVPPMVDLSTVGARDWVHWGLSGPGSLVRKRGGSGEIRDQGGRGAREGFDANPEYVGWRDGTPTTAVGSTATGVTTCGDGNGFALSVAGSGELRTVHVYAGLWMARSRLDVRLSGGGPARTLRLEDPHTSHTVQFVIRFRAPKGTRLLIDWTVEQTFGGCGNVGLQAAALR